MKGRPLFVLAPENAPGFTHVWAEGEQFRITDANAAALVICDLIEYSPDDGPNARVYRPRPEVTLDQIKRAVR